MRPWWRVPRGPWRVLVGGTLALLALRLAVSVARTGPVVMADEGGYLFHARVLAGGMPAELGPSPFYRGGYSVLLAPVVGLLHDPVAAYHGVLVVNALLAACLAPLLFLLLTRCASVGRRAAGWAAVAGAAYPSVTASSQVALAENLLFPLVAAWLLAASSALRRASVGWSLAAGAAAAMLWTAHGRMVVVLGLTVVALAGSATVRRSRDGVVAAAAGMAALVGGCVAGSVLNAHLREVNHPRVPFDELDRILGAFDEASGIPNVLGNLAGQGWYLVVATLGLALVVAGELPGAARRLRQRRPAPGDGPLALAALTATGLLLESALWFAVRERPDQLVYGRYAEPVAPVLIALGVVALGRAGRAPGRFASGLALGALTVLVAGLRAGDELPLPASRWNVAALPSVTGDLGPGVLALAGVAAVVALGVLGLVARRVPAAVGPAVLALFVPTTAYVVHLPVLRSEHDVYPPGWTSPRAVLDAAGATRVGYDNDHYDHVAVKVYQWALPRTRFVPYQGARDRVPARFAFSTSRVPPAPGARAVWRDPGRPQALWDLGR